MKIELELEDLVKEILKIASIAEDNLNRSFAYYLKNAKRPMIDDDVVDHLEREIEEKCLDIMVRERPFASDMRELTGILTLVSDIERLGDHAEDLENFTVKIKKLEVYDFKYIEKMANESMRMVHNAILSFINKDETLAISVINSDDLIDSLFIKQIDEIIELDKNDKISSSLAVNTTLLVKYIERIADHAVNIAEWVIYLIRGYYKDKQIF